MDGFNNINPGDKSSATSNATVEQPRTQQQQAEFEQHLGDVRQVDAVYPHRDLFDIADEDDRLIQAASGAALERGPPPGATTISIYDRRLRKLAEALKQYGQSMAGFDEESLLDYAKKLLPKDKVIVPALSMVSSTASLTPPRGPSERITVRPRKTTASSGRPLKQALADRSTRKPPEIILAIFGSWLQHFDRYQFLSLVTPRCSAMPTLCFRATRNSSMP
ncbi:hypothetical protein [Bradyrhizobium sp. ORS 86]|uniref:hypothetical protein n=1 Tax=unclassified Bradyrhizobium TaxID=2631580 RepID=UPI00388D206F